MRNPTYRNLSSRDTLFGLDLYDLAIVACVANIIFRFSRPESWFGKMINISIIAFVYLGLVLVKRKYPKGYVKNLVNFLFKKRRFLPGRDQELEPFHQEIYDQEGI